ncbi:hypothetical protein K503DRAFT_100192 [Rhizopogon vinicolor AM-OR11-026]|uniref:Secreted protein n=1 Tax=Rhizopogon vinicolor AM-OR11-026 TaxID=1314800 RepID=A0A1B7MFC6_9AGAM|nr:hypothetical protein K503DRAFT_100192 [Rhizopogon vinicolor AM-OR11-026]
MDASTPRCKAVMILVGLLLRSNWPNGLANFPPSPHPFTVFTRFRISPSRWHRMPMTERRIGDELLIPIPWAASI